MKASCEADMNRLFQLHNTQPVAYAIGAIALDCSAGMALGNVKVQGIGLGTFRQAGGSCHTFDFVK